MKESLKDDAVVTLEFPHLLNLIKQCQFDTIYHEHYSYLSVRTVSEIFKKHGLRIFKVEKMPTHGGSVRIYGCKKNAHHKSNQSIDKIIAEEKREGLFDLGQYHAFRTKAEKIRTEFLDFLYKAKDKCKKVCAYGAAAKGNTLINFAQVDQELIPFVADAANSKVNKFLPGSRIPILAPSSLLILSLIM